MLSKEGYISHVNGINHSENGGAYHSFDGLTQVEADCDPRELLWRRWFGLISPGLDAPVFGVKKVIEDYIRSGDRMPLGCIYALSLHPDGQIAYGLAYSQRLGAGPLAQVLVHPDLREREGMQEEIVALQRALGVTPSTVYRARKLAQEGRGLTLPSAVMTAVLQ